MLSNSTLLIKEEELIIGLKNKDIASFEYLYENYSHSLYTIVLKITSDTFLVEDVLQDVFIKIWSNIESYDHKKGRLFTWMSHVAKNVTIDVLQSKQGRKKSITYELSDDSFDSLFMYLNIDIIDIRKQLVKLKRNYQVVLELAYFYDLSSEEISKLLKLPLGTVKTRRKRALQQLRKFYSVQLLN